MLLEIEPTRQWLIESLLDEQQTLTAVDKFSQRQSHHESPSQENYYRDLIPATTPGIDEQYAFEVDLDACSGCKACVVACHNLNGLEEDELWRSVGLLHGGTSENEPSIEFVDERGQQRPADWPKDGVSLVQLKMPDPTRSNGHANGTTNGQAVASNNGHATTNGHKPMDTGRLHKQWIKAGSVADFPKDGGSTIKYGEVQIAVYNFASRSEWYACQNMCPHKNAFVLSRGIIGSEGDVPKIACPLHKKPFSLKTGASLSGEDFSVKVFPVKVVDGQVLVELPPQRQLDALLSTKLHCITACDAEIALECTECV